MAEAGARIPPRRIVAAGLLGSYAALTVLVPRNIGVSMWAALLAIPIGWWVVAGSDRWLGLFAAATLLLPPLPVALGDSGPHLALLAALLGLLAGVVRAREWRLHPSFLGSALVLYFGVLASSIAAAAFYSGPAIAAAALARAALLGISLYAFFYAAYVPGSDVNEGGLKLVYWLGAASAAFAVIDFWFQFTPPAGFGAQFVWLPSGVLRRAQGVFYDAMTLGNLSAFFLAMTAAALCRPRSERPLSSVALAVGGVIFTGSLVLSFSRAALVNAATAITAIVIVCRSRLPFRGIAAAAAFLMVAAVALGVALPSVADLYWGRLSGTARFFFSAPESVLSGRVDSWRVVGGFLIDHPAAIVSGVGYKTLPYASVTGEPIIVDNTYLSTLAETGVIGLFALLFLCFAILRSAYRAAASPNPRAAFCGACLFGFWIGQMVQMFSGDVLTYWRVLPLYFWFLGLATRSERIQGAL